MQFSKPMIELVFEIRRFVSPELKPAIKLANPDLFSELQRYYHGRANAVTKALIKELFYLAGNPWPARLAHDQENPPQSVRVYRGQVQVHDKPTPASKAEEQATQKRKTRIYRRQVVTAP